MFPIVGRPCKYSRPRPQYRFVGNTDDAVSLCIVGRGQDPSFDESIGEGSFGCTEGQ